MYGKEASNRKQEIDRQHHTIPNQRKQRPKDKHCGIPLIPIYKNTIRIQYLNLEIFVDRKNTCVRTHIDV